MDIVLRATAMFAAVFILLRLMGKRELGQMTPFELVTLVVIGDLVQQGVTHNDFSVTGAVIAIVTFAFWTLVLSLASYFSPGARNLLEGKPSVLVFQGDVDRRMLSRNRMTIIELESEMRLAGIRRLSEVEWALLEPNGKISFILRDSEDEKPKQQDETSAA